MKISDIVKSSADGPAPIGSMQLIVDNWFPPGKCWIFSDAILIHSMDDKITECWRVEKSLRDICRSVSFTVKLDES